MEQDGLGKQYEVLGWASPPSVPVEPRPVIVASAGIGIGVLLFVGPLLGRALLFPVVLSEARLIDQAEVPILITIPRIPTQASKRRARLRRFWNAGVSVAAGFVLAAVLGLRYLDLL